MTSNSSFKVSAKNKKSVLLKEGEIGQSASFKYAQRYRAPVVSNVLEDPRTDKPRLYARKGGRKDRAVALN